MASPYIPKTQEEYLANLLAYLISVGSRISNWKPGSRLRTFSEAVSLELARADADYYQFYRQAIREACYATFNFNLQAGARASGQLRVQHTGHLSAFPVPQFQVNLFGLIYETDGAYSIPVLSTFVDVNVNAIEPGQQYDIDALSIDTDQGKGDVSPDFGAERVYNPNPISGGTDQETEDQREARFSDFINNLARSTLQGIKNAVRSVPGVVDAYVDENKNPITSLPETGWILIYITDGTVSPPPALITLVQKVVDGDPADPVNFPGYRAAGTRSYVTGIATQAVNVIYEIDVLNSCPLSDLEIENLASNAMQNYCNTRGIGEDVLHQKLESVALELRPDFYRVRVTTPAANVTVLPGFVPKIGGTGGGTITCSLVTRMNTL